MLQNDIHAHAPSVKSIQDAGQHAIMADGGKSTAAKRKLDDMTRLWNEVQEKSHHREEELEEALKEVSVIEVVMVGVFSDNFGIIFSSPP